MFIFIPVSVHFPLNRYINDKKRAVMILDVEEIPEAISVLAREGFSLLNDEVLYNLKAFCCSS